MLPQEFESLNEKQQGCVEEYVNAMNALFEEFPDREPSEYTIEALNKAASNLGLTANMVRATLTRLKVDGEKVEVYVKSTASKPSTSATASAGGGKKMNKAEAIKSLEDIIAKSDIEVDNDITSKFTGKAASWLYEVVVQLRPDLLGE